jgi:hypothetical protein
VESEAKKEGQRSVVWGLVLIAIGATLLLAQFGVLEAHDIGRLWPLVFVAISASQMVEGRYGSAVSFLLMGAWFLACNFEWMGLTYRNSWGLLLVAHGTGMVIRSLTGEGRRLRAWKEARRD